MFRRDTLCRHGGVRQPQHGRIRHVNIRSTVLPHADGSAGDLTCEVDHDAAALNAVGRRPWRDRTATSVGRGEAVTEPIWNNAVWRKSTRSSGNNACVEVALLGDRVAIRDSKIPDSPVLIFSLAEWRSFIQWIVDSGGGVA